LFLLICVYFESVLDLFMSPSPLNNLGGPAPLPPMFGAGSGMLGQASAFNQPVSLLATDPLTSFSMGGNGFFPATTPDPFGFAPLNTFNQTTSLINQANFLSGNLGPSAGFNIESIFQPTALGGDNLRNNVIGQSLGFINTLSGNAGIGPSFGQPSPFGFGQQSSMGLASGAGTGLLSLFSSLLGNGAGGMGGNNILGLLLSMFGMGGPGAALPAPALPSTGSNLSAGTLPARFAGVNNPPVPQANNNNRNNEAAPEAPAAPERSSNNSPNNVSADEVESNSNEAAPEAPAAPERSSNNNPNNVSADEVESNSNEAAPEAPAAPERSSNNNSNNVSADEVESNSNEAAPESSVDALDETQSSSTRPRNTSSSPNSAVDALEEESSDAVAPVDAASDEAINTEGPEEAEETADVATAAEAADEAEEPSDMGPSEAAPDEIEEASSNDNADDKVEPQAEDEKEASAGDCNE
jgi:hypothetical protein